jgi:hypothetical protein
VVVCAQAVVWDQGGFTREEAQRKDFGRDFIKYGKLLQDRGIPIILSSGNFGDQEKRRIIDTVPAVLESDDLPFINVGAATLDGRPWPNTQGQGTQDGTQLTIYAVGEEVDVHDHLDGGSIRKSGTSIAAPAVAGIIAVHMTYQPWDRNLGGVERVKGIRRWIRSPESSWERIKNQFPDNPDMKVNMVSTPSLLP